MARASNSGRGSERAGGFYRRRGKRLFDLALTVPLLVALAPILGVVAIAVRVEMGAPVLFRQRRPGLDGRPFTLLKFRTMRDAVDARGERLPDRQRLTRLGSLLRRTSLDELPELWNVLRGEMSLVGPRPLLMSYLERYGDREMRRHEVPPGITGWAQIHGRNRTTWEERFRRDLEYLERCSLAFDCRILLATLVSLARDDGGLESGERLGEYPGAERAAEPPSEAS